MAFPNLDAWGDVELLARATEHVWFARYQGQDVVVRSAVKPRGALSWELDLVTDAAAAGVVVPQIVPTRKGYRNSGHAVLWERLAGHQPASEADWRAVADALQVLHSLGSRPPRPGPLVTLSHLPADVADRCRAAEDPLADLPVTVILGAVEPASVLVEDGRAALLNWDEARVDSPLYDLAALPGLASPLNPGLRAIASQALHAREVAISWTHDRPYAQWHLSQLTDR